MQKVLVSASHFDTLCQDAWKLFEEHHLEVIYDPGKEFPAYSTEEIRAIGNREEFAAALIGMDDYRDEEKYRLLPNLKAVAKFGVGVDGYAGDKFKLSADVYDPDDVKLRLRATYDLNDGTALMGQFNDVTNKDDERAAYFGIRQSF